MPERNIMVLIDGDGWKKGAKIWLKKAVEEKRYISEENQDKNILIFSLTEFFTWANDTFQ